jgi:glycosyltransferase involved in cell wall biosynthesis
VVPLRIGGGTRLKILYAWAMQRAIVSTSIGHEGLEGSDGTNILVRDEPEAFADAVVDVITDPNRRQSLAAHGRTLVESRYDWDVLTHTMHTDYAALLHNRPA